MSERERINDLIDAMQLLIWAVSDLAEQVGDSSWAIKNQLRSIRLPDKEAEHE